MQKSISTIRLALLSLIACSLLAKRCQCEETKLDFDRDVRPILSDNCFFCHGPDEGKRQGDLRLDRRADAVASGAIIDGDWQASELLKRIESSDADKQMPPPDSTKKLSDQQKQILRRWLEQGAVYQDHWAYRPITRPTIPEVGDAKLASPIDHFIVSRLHEAKLTLSNKAEPWRLYRRLCLDLTGLPPSPEQLQRFLSDSSPERWSKAIDALLESPHFGERMAIGWLDIVRFSDTVGYHGDQNQNIFPYRDYVIDSFNSNKPFDRFTIEQLAGDLLPNPTEEQRIATGFLRLNMMTREGGAQPGEYFAKYQADRVRTVGMAWLGSTIGCAECHDHKYDPFTMKDFYSLSAYFADLTQWGVYMDYTYTPNPDLRGFSNDHPFVPELFVDNRFLKQRLTEIERATQELSVDALKDPQTKATFENWRSTTFASLKEKTDRWNTLTLDSIDESAEQAFQAMDGTIELVDDATLKPDLGKKPKNQPESKQADDEAEAKRVAANTEFVEKLKSEFGPDWRMANRRSPDAGKQDRSRKLIFDVATGPIAALRLELLPVGNEKPKSFRHGVASGLINLSARLIGPSGDVENITFYRADASHSRPRYRSSYPVVGVLDGWLTDPAAANQNQSAIWWLEPGTVVKPGQKLEIDLNASKISGLRISVTPLAQLRFGDEPGSEQISKLSEPFEQLDEPSQTWQATQFVLSTGQPKLAYKQFREMLPEYLECRGGKAWTMVAAAREPTVTRVFPRGNWQDESGTIVQPRPPEFLGGSAAADSARQSRLDLAKWLVSRENPLTARVVVNRLWRQFYGAGLSQSIEDFGAQGDAPSHPELLDWLATELIESGWNIKHIVKLMVMAEAYQQDSRVRPDAHSADPLNRLLAFQRPKRLEAELIRDSALAAAGLLYEEIGGPSVKPYQPPGYYANLQFPDRDYLADRDYRQYRRGVYIHWQRTFLHPMLANFDAPSREDCIAARNQSNTPQQALTLLNDPTFNETARRFAERLLHQPEKLDDAGRLRKAFTIALMRSPSTEELESLHAFLQSQRTAFTADPERARNLLSVGNSKLSEGSDPVETASWTAVCRILINLHEFTTNY